MYPNETIWDEGFGRSHKAIRIKLYKKLQHMFEKSTGLQAEKIKPGPDGRKIQLTYYLAFLGWAKKNKRKLVKKMGKKQFVLATNELRDRVQAAKVKYTVSK